MFRRRSLLALAAAFALAACSAGGDGRPVLKVGSQKGAAKSVMLAAGVLEGAPYRVEWSEFPAAQHLLEALSAGAIDVGGVGDAPFLFAYSSGAKIKAVQASKPFKRGESTAIIVKSSSAIRAPRDLKGARVATGRGSIGHYLLLSVLEREGLRPSDVDLVFLAPGDAKAAFSTGAIDAWVTWGPYVGAAVLHDKVRIVADGRGYLNGVAFQAANDAAIEGKRAQLADFLQRLAKAQAWAAANKPAYAKVLSEETGLPLDVATFTVERQITGVVPIDATLIAEVRQVLERFARAGLFDRVADLRGAFDPSLSAPAPGR